MRFFTKIVLIGFSLTVNTQSWAKDPADISKSIDYISIELNKLEQQKSNCISYFLLKNHSKFHFDDFQVEMIAFDKQNIIISRFLSNFKRIGKNKTLVKLFGIQKVACTSISKILINDMHKCTVSGKPSNICLDLIKTSQKTKVELFK